MAVNNANFALSGYSLAHGNWWYSFIQSCLGRLKNFIMLSKEDRFFNYLEEVPRFFSRYLFFLEFQMNDGACLVYKGNAIPGRGKKCGEVICEFAENGLFQLNVANEELTYDPRRAMVMAKCKKKSEIAHLPLQKTECFAGN